MCILAELYHEWYTLNEKPWEEGKEEWARNEDLWEQAEQCLAPELFQELQLSVVRLMDLETCHTFQAGFSLAVQLMQEAYAAAPQSAKGPVEVPQ